jgi:hypothetical protein
VAKRSPILGYNHNVRYRGLVFHVQTEDSGVLSPHLFTHLFHGGVIVSTRKLVYDAGSNEEAVKALMQAQHKAVMKDLRKGAFDDKIDQYLGGTAGLEARSGAPSRPSQPAEPDSAPEIEAVEAVDRSPTVPVVAAPEAPSPPAAPAVSPAQLAVLEADSRPPTTLELEAQTVYSPGIALDPSPAQGVPVLLRTRTQTAERTSPSPRPNLPAITPPPPPSLPPPPPSEDDAPTMLASSARQIMAAAPAAANTPVVIQARRP